MYLSKKMLEIYMVGAPDKWIEFHDAPPKGRKVCPVCFANQKKTFGYKAYDGEVAERYVRTSVVSEVEEDFGNQRVFDFGPNTNPTHIPIHYSME